MPPARLWNVAVEPGAGEAKRTSLVIDVGGRPPRAPTCPSPAIGLTSQRDGQRWTHLADVSATARSYTATGFKPATLRYYRVFAAQPGWNRPGVRGRSRNTTVGITEPSEVHELHGDRHRVNDDQTGLGLASRHRRRPHHRLPDPLGRRPLLLVLVQGNIQTPGALMDMDGIE